jgi:hypothetical protein
MLTKLSLSYNRIVPFTPAGFAAAPTGTSFALLDCGGHSRLQRAILDLPGQPVTFEIGRISVVQVASQRPSYINGLLIQSRGTVVDGGCSLCRLRGFSPFPRCIQLVGHFGGACGNCKWRDLVIRYRVDGDSDGDEYEVSEPESPAAPASPARRLLEAAPSSSMGEDADAPVLFRPGSGTEGDLIQVDSDDGAYNGSISFVQSCQTVWNTSSCCSCLQLPSGNPCKSFTFLWCMG